MQARHEELQEDMRALEFERDQRDWMRPVVRDASTAFLSKGNAISSEDAVRPFGKSEVQGSARREREAIEAESAFQKNVREAKQRLQALTDERAKNADELSAILLEKEDRKTIEVDVDLSDVEAVIAAETARMEKATATPRFTVPKRIQTPGFSRSSEATRAQRLTKPTPPRFTAKPASVDKAA